MAGAPRRLGAHRADHLRRAREPAQNRAGQGGPDHQGDQSGGAQGTRRAHRNARPPLPVREGARKLGERSRALPRDGAGVPEGVAWQVSSAGVGALSCEDTPLTRTAAPSSTSPLGKGYTPRQTAPECTSMQWSDDGIVLGCRKHGESSVILELMTRDNGPPLGLAHAGRSRRLQPVLQPGNTVQAVWRARLDEHLGTYAVEA